MIDWLIEYAQNQFLNQDLFLFLHLIDEVLGLGSNVFEHIIKGQVQSFDRLSSIIFVMKSRR